MTITQDSISLTSVYVPARDGTRLAVDIWLPADLPESTRLPTVFTLTRYWRSLGFRQDTLAWQKHYEEAKLLTARGYAFVVADSRGAGASFGTRECEFSETEIGDVEGLIEWIACQLWSNGKVFSTGTSYTGNTALLCASDKPPCLKTVVPFAADFDVYAQLIRPGGLESFFTRDWGAGVWSMDQNDIETLVNNMATPPPEPIANNVTGIRPVDDDQDGSLLAAALEEHTENFNVGIVADHLNFRNQGARTSKLIYRSSVFSHRDAIERSAVPIHYRTGWLDAGTQQGALSLFNTFSNPMRVTIGPWNHGNTSRADPFIIDEPQALQPAEKIDLILNSLSYSDVDNEASSPKMGILEYYTYGENVWKTTKTWPLPETQITRLYLAGDHTLNAKAPGQDSNEDIYCIDPTTTTGLSNRWHTNLGGGSICYPDRRDEDKKLLIYETPPLQQDTEITGHPLLRLFVASNKEECDFLVYLEDVAPDGTVYYITEGCLRLGNRKINTQPPYAFEGPYHSCRVEDYQALVPGEVTEIKLGLFPTSVLFRKGHRIRLAIAGADEGTFLPLENIENTQWRIQHNNQYPSYLELPVIPR